MNSMSASAWPPAGGWQEHSKRAVLGGAIGGNNSWTTGEGTNHGYQASERTHDFMVRDGDFDAPGLQPFIEVFSAGNSGPGSNTLTAPKEAKNLIVTASSRNYRAGSIESISSFSSRGPAVDGRQVPTIAAPGEEIASARNDTGGSCTGGGYDIGGTGSPPLYSLCSGTSRAAPHAAGAVALVGHRQQFSAQPLQLGRDQRPVLRLKRPVARCNQQLPGRLHDIAAVGERALGLGQHAGRERHHPLLDRQLRRRGADAFGLRGGDRIVARLVDPPAARLRQTSDAVRLLPPRLDLDRVPEKTRPIVVARDLFPRDVLVRVTQPKEPVGPDHHLLWRHMDLSLIHISEPTRPY